MASVPTKTFEQLVSGQAAAVQASASGLVDYSVGSILRAVADAVGGVVLWIQGLILTLLAVRYASTSTGTDLDSWMADFGVVRLAATAAIGDVTFSRGLTTGTVVVPIGATISNAAGDQVFVVTLDATNPAYNAGQGGYVMGVGTGTVTVPAQASVPGAAGNAAPGVIALITSPISGVDTVTNSLAFAGGADAESDAALRSRFTLIMASLSRGTKEAVLEAVLALGATVQAQVVENLTYAGSPAYGFFYVVADDGSGAPPGSFLTACQNAVEAVRPLTTTFQIYAPTLLTVPVALTVGVVAGYDATATKAQVHDAIQAYINGLGMGAGLVYNRIIQVAYDASPGVATVTGLLVNGGTADIAGNSQQTIKPGTVTVS